MWSAAPKARRQAATAPDGLPARLRRLEIIGHRGCRGLRPENTIVGFAHALTLGVDRLELDVGLSADGVVTVSHDPVLNSDLTRDKNGTWLAGRGALIRNLSFDALQAFDVGRIRPGTRYAAAFPAQTGCEGARIPSLSAVLGTFPEARLLIELKTFPPHPDWTASPTELAAAVLAALDAADATERTTVQSFDWRALRFLRAIRPVLALGWLTSRETSRSARLWWDGPSPADFGRSVPRTVAAEGGPIWAAEHHELSRARIQEAHELGLRVLAWTVNEPARICALMDWRIDGVITDRPDLAMAVITERGPTAPARDEARPFTSQQ